MKDDKKYILQVNPQLTFNVNTQIKEQLKWLIGIEQMEAGDMLPTASQLADELGLNRNTVNWVYNQLRDEGLVSIQKGRGTQIAGGFETKHLLEERKPMQQLLNDTIREAAAMGFDLPSFFIAGLAYSLLQPPSPARKLRILLVECRGHDYPFYRQEIERATDGEVETLFLGDSSLNEEVVKEAVMRSDVVITTLNHAEETKALFARYDSKVIVIGATLEASQLLEIAKLQAGTHVAFVCLGRTGGEWMANRIREAGIHQLHVDIAGMNEPERLNDALQHSHKIYASAAVFSELKKLQPDKTSLFPMKLEQSSENLLHEIAAQKK
ncbi:GntR family transcriptional regulator [Paenibacillus chondroitinus]|uniref:GntR family transcriptional regulator n=1 Tax=Paenibacillus chondroitinus TaxID=59842 RepID=A0ABU6DEH2_9BACL|nr:GntR family transcriptional regulator [Paenibacillus chondroitinus]MCY9658938.1 GntR family transcriptional regulator [Paenibacillus anseongense]MEB4795800.1 GntR family transcriptional regulator [Paenibacillus chondroitinus]